MPFRPPSIREETLPVFLNRTRAEHNGLGYAEFEQRMQLGVPKPKIAKDFGRSTTRIWYWVSIYNDEKTSHAKSQTS